MRSITDMTGKDSAIIDLGVIRQKIQMTQEQCRMSPKVRTAMDDWLRALTRLEAAIHNIEEKPRDVA